MLSASITLPESLHVFDDPESIKASPEFMIQVGCIWRRCITLRSQLSLRGICVPDLTAYRMPTI